MSRRTGATYAGQKETSVEPKDNAQSKQAMLLAQDAGHFSMIKALHLADLITVMNGEHHKGLSSESFANSQQATVDVSAVRITPSPKSNAPNLVMSIVSSLRYCLDPKDLTSLWLAFGFMPFGLFFDFFDGKVARWRKKSSLMGQELDSLADLVCTRLEIFIFRRKHLPDDSSGIVWRCSRCGGIRHRIPHQYRSTTAQLLCPLRVDETRTIQCHCCNATKRRVRKVEIL